MKHKFSQQEYLNKISRSKFGLCLRGYGSKCHREVELMAFGTVPIVTPEVSITSYMDPPIKGVHYFVAENPSEFKNIVDTTSKEQWENMSKSCSEWYNRNVLSKNSWNSTIEYILYGK